jgi:hypothetical protein
MRLDQLAKDLLHKIVNVSLVGDPTTDKAAQTGSLGGDDLGEASVLLNHRVHARRPF